VAGHVPIARHAEPELPREVYSALLREGLTDYTRIIEADEERGLACLSGDRELWRIVLDAAHTAKGEADDPSLDDLLPPVEASAEE